MRSAALATSAADAKVMTAVTSAEAAAESRLAAVALTEPVIKSRNPASLSKFITCCAM
jgi:hypothetical protein